MSSNVAAASGTKAGDRKVFVPVFASVFGWSLDLFDLFILLYVAPVVGKLFFPSDQPTLSLAAVYASFAVTLLMRPVGSAIFGSYADKHGRKRAMTLAVVGVGVATAAFGVLPTIAQVGLLAPVLFLALRLVQGIFVGGVVATTHTVGTEFVPPHWRGTVSGMVGGGGAGLGALLASLAFWMTSNLFPGEQFDVWGWRVMFFSGILSSVLGLFIFKYLEESPYWLKAQAAKDARREATVTSSPLKRLMSSEYRTVLLMNLLITAGAGSAYYVTSGYLPAFLKVVNRVPNETASLILILAAAAATLTGPFIGYVSDRIGRKPVFIVIGAVAAIALPFLYLNMAALGAANGFMIGVYALLIAFLGNAALAPVPIFLNERFPTAVRASGTGLSWNIGFAIGGMMPTFVSLASRTPADIPFSLAVFCAGSFVVLLLGGIFIGETKGKFD
ncbi:MAG: MFS transporter [Hyphomonadaceae bacterium]|nr:MFS transporter [Hyphomonadaceae bacterium]